MEDIKDNLPTEEKRYYLGHVQYFYTDAFIDKMNKKIKDSNLDKIFIQPSEPFKQTQLVCASNKKSAQEALTESIESEERYIVIKCHIENLIVGE